MLPSIVAGKFVLVQSPAMKRLFQPVEEFGLSLICLGVCAIVARLSLITRQTGSFPRFFLKTVLTSDHKSFAIWKLGYSIIFVAALIVTERMFPLINIHCAFVPIRPKKGKFPGRKILLVKRK